MYGRRDVLEQLPELDVLARRQCHVLTRAQLADLGVSHHAVASHVAARRWSTVGPLLVVLHLGELSLAARRWVAVLNAGPTGGLCSLTALDQWGLNGWERGSVHVVVSRGQTPEPLPGVTVHESRRHSPDDLVRATGRPPAHTAARAGVDGAAWQSSARTASGLLAAVVQQRLASVDALSEELARAGRVRHRRVMATTLREIAGGADSLAEIDFGRLCARAGLPQPYRQSTRTDDLGRLRYRDVEWLRADGVRVIGEIDGIGHLDSTRWYDDVMRDAELSVAERDAVRFRIPSSAIHTEPDRVVGIVRRLLTAS
jgi:hypothetical protein